MPAWHRGHQGHRRGQAGDPARSPLTRIPAVERATALTRRTLGLFPIRVWRHFLQNNGFLLAAGVSYQALFAIFAAVYLVFAIAGLWLGGSADAIDAVIAFVNGYVPNLISEDSDVISPELVLDIATSATSLLSITGAIALVTVIWTAIGWVTFSRRAVRDIFGLAPDRRSYLMLKARDLLAALLFGVSLIAGSALSSGSAAILSWLLSLLGWDAGSSGVNVMIRVGTVIVSFAILTGALAAMVRFLTGTSLRWHTIWPGALLGSGAMTVLQFGVGFLLGYTPTNPLLATFAIFIGLLLWFRINGVVMLIAASWIAVTAQDREVPLTPADRERGARLARLEAARTELGDALTAYESVGWFRRGEARRRIQDAARALHQIEATSPPADVGGSR